VFRYYSLGGYTAITGGIYAELCHTFLVLIFFKFFCGVNNDRDTVR